MLRRQQALAMQSPTRTDAHLKMLYAPPDTAARLLTEDALDQAGTQERCSLM